jgi:hypothetical protein
VSRAAIPTILLSLTLLVGCGDAPASTGGAPEAASSAALADGTVHLIWFNRLQGYAEGVPCSDRRTGTLAAASILAADLEAAGDKALLVCIGDSLLQSATISTTLASKRATRAKAAVNLKALGAAGVDVYVPGHGDMLFGVANLLDQAMEHGVPVVLSNVTVEGREDVLPFRVIEHDGIRLALLGVIAKNSDLDTNEVEPGVTIDHPITRARQVSRDVIRRGLADAVVLFSNLSKGMNQALGRIPDVHYVVGCFDAGLGADTVVVARETGTSQVFQVTAGRAVGHTTLHVSDGNWALANISERNFLPDQLRREQDALDFHYEHFGTTDPEKLAPVVMPENPESFLEKLELMQENREWLVEMKDFQGSFLEHRSAKLPAVPDGNPVQELLAQQGAAIRKALASLSDTPPVLASDSIPLPTDCEACHPAQFAHWESTAHAHSYDLLVGVERESDTACLICHTVGLGVLGGYTDPRLKAPFGGISCFNCHEADPTHVSNRRLTLDPLHVSADEDEMSCKQCHNPSRSPGFSREASMDVVRCPPMRPDEPALVLARVEVLKAVAHRRRVGAADAWDDYMEGRALVGMGRIEEGMLLIRKFAPAVVDQSRLTLAAASYADDHGDTETALHILRSFLVLSPADKPANLLYLQLLMDPTDPRSRSAELALSHARTFAPVEGHELLQSLLPFYLLQVDAYLAVGQKDAGRSLLRKLSWEFERDEGIGDRLRQEGIIPR